MASQNDHLHIRLDPPLKQAVEFAARERGLTLSSYARAVLAESALAQMSQTATLAELCAEGAPCLLNS
jgi:hypothetical protein